MNKTTISKLKKQVKKAICEFCEKEDAEKIFGSVDLLIDHYYNPPLPEKKGYIASTGGSIVASVVRTKGQSERADANRGRS